MKKPSVPSRSGSSCRWDAASRVPPFGVLALEIVGGELGVLVQEALDHLLALLARDRADRVDEGPARRGGGAGGGQHPALQRRQLRRSTRDWPASADRAATGASRGRCTADRRGRGHRRRRAGARRHRRPRPGPSEPPSAAQVRSSAAARPRMALDRDDLPFVAHQRGEMGGLAAGRRTEIEDALPRFGRDHARHEHRTARLGRDHSRLEQLGGVGVERSVEHEALGEPLAPGARPRRAAPSPARGWPAGR